MARIFWFAVCGIGVLAVLASFVFFGFSIWNSDPVISQRLGMTGALFLIPGFIIAGIGGTLASDY